MGLSVFRPSNSSFDRPNRPIVVNVQMPTQDREPVVGVAMLQNPDPRNYVIARAESVGLHLVVEIIYPDCTNYEGRKVLLFENVTLVQLLRQKAIDPHFSKNQQMRSPMARFEPTERGWALALAVAKDLAQ